MSNTNELNPSAPSTPIRPIGKRVLVQRRKRPDVTSSGIAIVSDDMHFDSFATVLSTYPDSVVQKGDVVLIPRFGGTDIEFDREEGLLILEEKRLLCRSNEGRNLEPLNGHAIVKLSPVEEETSGGIFIPEKAQKDSEWGEVIGIAEEGEEGIELFDRVLVLREQGMMMHAHGMKYVIVEAKKIKAREARIGEQ